MISPVAKRPEREGFVELFFPELHKQNSAADREAYVRLSMAACESILHDFAKLYDKGFAAKGPGILVIRLHGGLANAKDASEYMSLDEIREDLEMASKMGHSNFFTFFEDAINAAESAGVTSGAYAPVMLVDNSSVRVYLVDKANPTGDIASMLEEAGK